MLKRILCFLGKHDWLYDTITCDHSRCCKLCDTWQTYIQTGVDGRMEWKNYDSTPFLCKDDPTKCYEYNCDKFVIPSQSAGLIQLPTGEMKVLCDDCFRRYRKEGISVLNKE